MSMKSWCSSWMDVSSRVMSLCLSWRGVRGRARARVRVGVGVRVRVRVSVSVRVLGLALALGLGLGLLSWMSARALRAAACPGPCRNCCWKISDASPPSTACSISSWVAFGLTILSCSR